MTKHVITIFIILLANISTSYASIRGESKVDRIPSKILAEQRELLVHLPNNYQQNTALNYPVLYLLDGQRNFSHAAGTLDLLNQDGKAQEMIIIAIKIPIAAEISPRLMMKVITNGAFLVVLMIFWILSRKS